MVRSATNGAMLRGTRGAEEQTYHCWSHAFHEQSRPIDGELVVARGVGKGAAPRAEQVRKVVPRRGNDGSKEGICGRVGGKQGKHGRELEDGCVVT
jgi:hypothetical protein